MDSLLLVIILICIVVIISGCFIIIEESYDSGISSVAMIMLLTFLILIGFSIAYHYESGPTALDVYQGKTRLLINGYYQDSIFIKTDSTVIYTSGGDSPKSR